MKGYCAAAAAFVLACGCGGGNGAGGDGGDHPGGDGSNVVPGDGDVTLPDAPPPANCGNGMRERGEACDGDADCDASCHVIPVSGAPQSAADALAAINAARAAADVRGARLETHVDASAQNHATYYATNAAAYAGGLSPHAEDSNFPNGFTGAQFFDRMPAAGFQGQPMFETMAFFGEPNAAVDIWLNSVFHRVPILHPNMTEFGYGLSTSGGRNNDVADYAQGQPERPHQVVVWPPPDATGIPGSFNTQQEGPQPPSPPGGGSVTGPLVSVFFAGNGVITSHAIKDASGNTLPDTMVAKDDPNFGPFLQGGYCFYAAGPAASGSKFTVEVAGTIDGTPFSTAWQFTTE